MEQGKVLEQGNETEALRGTFDDAVELAFRRALRDDRLRLRPRLNAVVSQHRNPA